MSELDRGNGKIEIKSNKYKAMAFLIITESIEETIKFLESTKGIEQRKYELTGNEVDKSNLQSTEDKLQTAIRYKRLFDKKSDYAKIKHLKTMNPERYTEECRVITKGLKGITFQKDRLTFKVQIQRNKKRFYIGAFDTPDDALEILQKYI